MKILALDLGKFKTMCCFFDTQTRKHEFLTATTEEAREAKETAADVASRRTKSTDSEAKPTPKTNRTATPTTNKPRRARKPVCVADANA